MLGFGAGAGRVFTWGIFVVGAGAEGVGTTWVGAVGRGAGVVGCEGADADGAVTVGVEMVFPPLLPEELALSLVRLTVVGTVSPPPTSSHTPTGG